jgi:hypothetical protein
MKKVYNHDIHDPGNYVFVVHQSTGKPYLIGLKEWNKNYEGEVACMPLIVEGNKLIKTRNPVVMIDKSKLDPIIER